jgi:dephospho-CoA kinase
VNIHRGALVSNWPGKYVIGLTGNIATGKSVARRMLEHLGAYTIDADALSHRAIARGAPGYQAVVDKFGKWILEKDGEIDRVKLGRIVFNDPEGLKQLEAVVHPLVRNAASMLIQRATQTVIVLEAIKLLESELRHACDSIWVTDAPQEVQVERLMRKRRLSRADAQTRVLSQSAQADKVAAADVVIHNTGSYDELWKQVTAQWKKISPAADATPLVQKAALGDFSVERGRPRDSESIAEFITRASKGRQKMTPDDVMAGFGDKAYMLLKSRKDLVGVAGWQVENLVVRTTDLYLEDQVEAAPALDLLIKEVERASGDLQCEASLAFPGSSLAAHAEAWTKLGYERRTPNALGVQAWQDAASESMPSGSVLYFKQLRQDRILRPI